MWAKEHPIQRYSKKCEIRIYSNTIREILNLNRKVQSQLDLRRFIKRLESE